MRERQSELRLYSLGANGRRGINWIFPESEEEERASPMLVKTHSGTYAAPRRRSWHFFIGKSEEGKWGLWRLDI